MTKTIHIPTGFHLGIGGNQNGIGNYYKRLAAARIPFVIMSADQFPAEAQSLAKADPQTRHFVGYRRTGSVSGAAHPRPPSNDPNVPRWGISAQEASDEHWAWHTAADILPKEYDGSVTYLMTVNEPNKDSDAYVEWLADVEYHTCLKALAAGFRYAVFGWAGGNPEPRHWQGPNMVRLLNLIDANPGKLALGIHEYSWTTDTLWSGVSSDGETYSLVGRAHSTVLQDYPNISFIISEFGWAERAAPPAAQAVREIRQVAELYAKYPRWLGAAIWYLGGGFDQIHNTVNTYIAPLTDEIISNPIDVDDVIVAPPTHADGRPRVQYTRTVFSLPQATSLERYLEVAQAAFTQNRTVGFSYDDAGIGALTDKTAVLYDIPASEQRTFNDWYRANYPGTIVKFNLTIGNMDTPPTSYTGDGSPRQQYARVVYVVPQTATLAVFLSIAKLAYAEKRTISFSYDDAGIGNLADKTAVLFGIPASEQQTFTTWFATHYPGTKIEFRPFPSTIQLVYRPCDTTRVTQHFGANPTSYAQFGLPGHEGIDFGVGKGLAYYAAAGGQVVHASDRQWSNAAAPSEYGWHIVINHGDYSTLYAHAQAPLPVHVDQTVAAGMKVGLSGNTGNSTGYHLHFSLLDKSGTIDPNNGYPNWRYGRPVNPAPFLAGLQPPPSQPTPPTGNARLGLHASADPGDLFGRTAEVDEFKELARVANGRSVVKILSAHSVSAIDQLVTAVPNAHWIVRAFMHFGDRAITPGQFFNDTINDTRRTVDALINRGIPVGNIIIELHNEPNLKDEGWGKSWLTGREFGGWLLDVHQRYKAAMTAVRFMYPGLSPGGDVAGVRTDATRFLNDSATAVAALDALAVHCYWSSGWPMSTALAHLDAHQKFNKPIWVTEASRNDRPTAVPVSQYASEYFQFWQECRKRFLVQGVTYFVASASNAYFAPECWIVDGKSRGIATEVQRLAAKPGIKNG